MRKAVFTAPSIQTMHQGVMGPLGRQVESPGLDTISESLEISC